MKLSKFLYFIVSLLSASVNLISIPQDSGEVEAKKHEKVGFDGEYAYAF